MANLITPEEFQTLARPASIHLDDNEVLAYIKESEQCNIIPAIGYEMYKNIIQYIPEPTPEPEPEPEPIPDPDPVPDEPILRSDPNDDSMPEQLQILLYGGEWQGSADNCCTDNQLHYCNGLKAATAYYTYAKMVKADGAIMARAGNVRHEDLYYRHADDKIRQYDDVMNVADRYLASCVAYIQSFNCCVNKMHGTRCQIRAIGH